MKRRIILIGIILILCLTFTSIGDSAWLAGWDYRVELQIADYAGDIGASVTWFPVTVHLTSTQGEEVFVELTTDAEYLKVAFTKADGTTELYAEKELFVTGYTSQYPPAHTSTYVKATDEYSQGKAYFATDPALSLTGVYNYNTWMVSGSTGNQRFHIDLGSAKIIKRIYYENFHHEGGFTDRGAQNFTFWGSNNAAAFAELTYTTDTNWTQLTIAQSTFDEHVGVDQTDPKFITVTNSTVYRYYAFKFADNYGAVGDIGVRRIELQTEPKAIYHVSRTGWTINANTSVYMYYDKDHADNTTYIGAINTAAGATVWDSNFKAVYHMVDDTTSTIKDSTSNDNDGTKVGANAPIETTGKVGAGQTFDGDDYIAVGDDVSLDITAQLTLSAWINITVDQTATFFGRDDSTNRNYILHYESSNTSLYLFVFIGDASKVSQIGSIGTGTWYYVTGTFDGRYTRLYINENLVDTDDHGVNTIDNDDVSFSIGSREAGLDRFLNGILDEGQVSNTARSAAWIKGSYNSGNDSLFTYGSEETEVVEVDNAIFFGTNF